MLLLLLMMLSDSEPAPDCPALLATAVEGQLTAVAVAVVSPGCAATRHFLGQTKVLMAQTNSFEKIIKI